MRALVTGAGGFLGKKVVAALLENGHSVRALLRPAAGEPPAEWKGKAEIVRADLRGRDATPALFEGVDVLVHLAAAVRGTPEAQFAATVIGTEKLLALMQQSGTKRIVLASSFSVYDWTAARGSLHEDTPLEAKPYERDGYTVSKMWQEKVVRRMSEKNGWTLTVLRPGFIYGPGGPPVSGAGFGAKKAFIVVAPQARLPLTHVTNCAEAFALAADKGVAGTFNIIDDERVSAWKYSGKLLRQTKPALRFPFPYTAGLLLAHLATAVSRILFPPKGGKLPGLLVPRKYRARFRPLGFPNKKAKEALGWQSRPVFDSENALT